MFEESERPSKGFKKTYMPAFDQINVPISNFFYNFVIIVPGLDPVFSKPGAGSGSPFLAKYLDPDSVNIQGILVLSRNTGRHIKHHQRNILFR
jgi:hypothetical protein